MITFQINGNEIKGEEGWTILEAARVSGIEIPTLCFHGALEPSGACRLCMVEVDEGKRHRIVASCLYPIRAGIKVDTESDRVRNVRRWILQLLVDEHPGSDAIRTIAH
ncbi:MAG: 2Fe-2S iron-sulfur cluster-binding protein, partial [Syntrophobacteraceae bacterium]